MIRLSTKFDFGASRWGVEGKPVFNSRYNYWRKNKFSLGEYRFHQSKIQTHSSPILGPTILTTWSK